nr:hypothetical protein [Tanacetum cinerariifolium]
MRMKQYLTHTDYALWEVIVNGDAPTEITSVSGDAEADYLTHTDYALWEVNVNGDAPTEITSVSGDAEADVPPKTTAEKIA